MKVPEVTLQDVAAGLEELNHSSKPEAEGIVQLTTEQPALARLVRSHVKAKMPTAWVVAVVYAALREALRPIDVKKVPRVTVN